MQQGSGREPLWSRLPVPAQLRRPRTAALILAAAGLIIGLAGGYVAGTGHSRDGARGSKPQASTEALNGSFPLTQTGPWCSRQSSRQLQLGMQVTNLSGTALVLGQIRAQLPAGMLTPVASGWGTCGQLPAESIEPSTMVPPGATAWFTVTFRVQVRCPRPVPVAFTIGYQAGGGQHLAKLAGFADLAQVPYTGCST